MIHPDHQDRHETTEQSKTCRVCSSIYEDKDNSSRLGICERCAYKIVIVLFIVLIISSYMVWFGVF